MRRLGWFIFFFWIGLILTLRIKDSVPPLNDIEVVYIFCIIPDSLNTNFGPRGWNPMFPRQVDKKCQEETCTFKGQATGKGLWVGFCCVQWQLSVRACCLPLSLQFQNTRRRKSGYSVNQEVDTTAGRLTIPSLFYLFFCDLRNNETFFIIMYARKLKSTT